MLVNGDLKMFGKPPDNFTVRVGQALLRPIQSRCAELAVLFDRGTLKDFHSIFPFVVDSLFGTQGTLSWDLRSITNTWNPDDFQALQHFLSPLGPFFKLIYTLLRDPLLKYEFSLAYLPRRVRESLNGNHMHPFYADLINVDPRSDEVVSLSLNPFDYYFFHFAYHLINPYHQRSYTSGTNSWNTVYYVLCCDYVLHFLPTTPAHVILPVLTYYNGKNPIYMVQPVINKHTKLLRNDALNIGRPQTTEHHPRNEIWRSETLMTVFIDVWLNNDQVLCSNMSLDTSFTPSPSPFKNALHMNELPTGEYIRIIRVLVKQLHAFAASAKMDDSHMGELKRIVIPYLQGRMYIFLRHLVHRWPLDGSFRLVLELWVSFLQPWRYPGGVRSLGHDVNSDMDDINTASTHSYEIDEDHLQFIAQNVLAYTVILQQLLPRFSRVDLSSPKIALILYRLTKVFAQSNLVPFLRQIEKCTENLASASPMSYIPDLHRHNLPPLSPTSSWSTNSVPDFSSFHAKERTRSVVLNGSANYHDIREPVGKWDTVIKQKILELEGPHFCYKPIFCTAPAREVYKLLQQIMKSEATAHNIVAAIVDERNRQSRGFFNFFRSLFAESSADEFTLEERKKVPTYLHLSLQHLNHIFQIPDDLVCYDYPSIDIIPSTSTPLKSDIMYMLTPQRVRERVKTMKYEGDPDLASIRSDEVKFLVRLLYQLSQKINEDFGGQLQNLHNRTDFWGRLSHQFLQPPTTFYRYDKSFPGRSPRISQNLPARVSLRYLAGQKFLFYFILLVILSKLIGFDYFSFVFAIFVCWFFYQCLKAAFEKRPLHQMEFNENSMEVDSFSGNESY